jgi:putative Mn2+ efflux pump MntP
LKIALYILFIIALAYNVFPLALGLNRDRRTPHVINVFHALIFGLIQGIMYWLGIILGSTFIHLLEEQQNAVVLGLLVAVSVRMAIESFKIRKGERLFSFDNYVKFVVMGVAAGINTFIIGMTAPYLSPFGVLMPFLLVIAGFAWSIAGISMNLSRKNIILSSLLHLLGSIYLFVFGLIYFFTNNWL